MLLKYKMLSLLKSSFLFIQRRCIGQPINNQPIIINDRVLVHDHVVHHINKRGLNFILIQMRCGTALVILVLVIALPNRPFVLAGAVPHLRTIICAAFTANYNPAGEASAPTGIPSLLALFQLKLHFIENLRFDDRWMALLKIMLISGPFGRHIISSRQFSATIS